MGGRRPVGRAHHGQVYLQCTAVVHTSLHPVTYGNSAATLLLQQSSVFTFRLGMEGCAGALMGLWKTPTGMHALAH